MNVYCQALGIGNAQKEYRTCRAIILRHGAGSAVDRIRKRYAKELAASEEARAVLEYLDRRRDNMRYGWLRKNGYYNSSAHTEAAAQILVARRCKQTGMHGRHKNAARVCTLIAKLRSAAWSPALGTKHHAQNASIIQRIKIPPGRASGTSRRRLDCRAETRGDSTLQAPETPHDRRTCR